MALGYTKTAPTNRKGRFQTATIPYRDAIQFLHPGLKVFEVLACTGKKKVFGVMVGGRTRVKPRFGPLFFSE